MCTWEADIVCLQESKLEGNTEEKVKEIWGNRWANYIQLEASGTRGGIVIIWDKREWIGEVSSLGMYTVTCSFSENTQKFQWHMTGVYAPNDR